MRLETLLHAWAPYEAQPCSGVCPPLVRTAARRQAAVLELMLLCRGPLIGLVAGAEPRWQGSSVRTPSLYGVNWPQPAPLAPGFVAVDHGQLHVWAPSRAWLCSGVWLAPVHMKMVSVHEQPASCCLSAARLTSSTALVQLALQGRQAILLLRTSRHVFGCRPCISTCVLPSAAVPATWGWDASKVTRQSQASASEQKCTDCSLPAASSRRTEQLHRAAVSRLPAGAHLTLLSHVLAVCSHALTFGRSARCLVIRTMHPLLAGWYGRCLGTGLARPGQLGSRPGQALPASVPSSLQAARFPTWLPAATSLAAHAFCSDKVEWLSVAAAGWPPVACCVILHRLVLD